MLGVLVFGFGTIVAVVVFLQLRDEMSIERARLVIYSIFALFVAFEVCAGGAFLTWLYRRKRK